MTQTSATSPAASPAKDTPKSQRTRARILDCAMRLFAEIGYAAATNTRIAEEVGLTRGAMLYHFPSREALVGAAITHIHDARLALMAAAAAPPGVDLADHAIDSYWVMLRHPAFIAFAELEAAARTDAGVAALIADAQAAFDRAQVGDQFSRMALAGETPRLQTSRDLAPFMLEGLARANLTYDGDERVANLLTVIKRAIRMINRKGTSQDLWSEDPTAR